MNTSTVHSISEGFQAAVDIIGSWSSVPLDPVYCWFRGVNDTKLSLLPGAHWRSAYNERATMVSFVQEGAAFVEMKGIDSWETYYLAQHHGVPTRLLDWTESFAAAMFFALDGAETSKTPCVWILQPEKLNEINLNWTGILAPENDPNLNWWLPGKNDHHKSFFEGKYSYDNRTTLAIYARKTNRRIVAQQGAFTLHGLDKTPLEKLIYDRFPLPDSTLARIEFDLPDLEKARIDLEILGVKRSAIYPDIDNFVKQLGQYYWP